MILESKVNSEHPTVALVLSCPSQKVNDLGSVNVAFNSTSVNHPARHFPIVEAAIGVVFISILVYLRSTYDKLTSCFWFDPAVREVEEETGVDGLEIVKPLIETFHVFNRNGRYKLKKTFWFEMKTASTVTLIPQLNEGIQQAVWILEKEIPQKFENAYENIKEVYGSLL